MKQVRFRMQKTVILALVAGICLLSIANNAMAATVKFGHVGPLFHGQTKGVEAFAAYVKEKTNGRIDIATFPMANLVVNNHLPNRCKVAPCRWQPLLLRPCKILCPRQL